MKITPAKDYKKPVYAIGVATILMAMTVTGCTDPVGYDGDVAINTDNTDQVDLAGAADIRPDETEYSKTDGDNPVLAGEVELDGDVAIEPTNEIELEGVIAIDETEKTECTKET
ncbi:MAG: hypothetical protein IKG30_03910 [Clostridiales bacterium]|jgi:hypothetical protein|nr:hypothetical protein [Clostridiales bacterium]